MQFPYGPLAPDATEMEPGTCVVANGVLPLRAGYGPAPSIVVSGTAGALPAAPRGVASIVLNGGTWKVFGFTEDDVYELQSDDTWSSLGGSFTLTSGDDWSTLHFGNYLLATNTTDGLVSYNVESPAGFSSVSAAGNPRFIFLCGNMLFGLDCLDSAGNRNNRLIRNSDFNSFTDWTNGAADYQPLEDGGALVAGFAISETAALVLQTGAIRMIQIGAAGGGALYALKLVSDGVGSVGARSCVSYDGSVYWLATDGFRRFSLGGGIETIGAGLIDDYFFDRVDQSALQLVQGAVDPFQKVIWWRYKRQGAASDIVFTDIIGYSWEFKRWVTSNEETSYFATIATPGILLDNMDSYGPMDSITIPLDSRLFQGGQPVFGALNGDYKFGTFSGGAQAATITTATRNSGTSGLISFATPIDDAPNATLELGVKDAISDTIEWKTAASKAASGRVPLRGRGMNVAFRWKAAANEEWTFARGIDQIGRAHV